MDIVKVKNASYAKYEEVLLRRDNLRKTAENYHLEFIRVFGDLITDSFRLKIECIRKKKMIAYCQQLVNQGKEINRNALTAHIEKQMLQYRKELDSMLADVKAVKNSKLVSPMDIQKIKKLYYALVKLIHPDLHPELADDEVLKDYWQRIVIAYNYNCLKDLEELDMLVRTHLEEKGVSVSELEVEGIDEKIIKVEQEIEEIITTNPYLYGLFLKDQGEIARKKQEYKDEIQSYQKYSEQLDEVLGTFEIKEMLS